MEERKRIADEEERKRKEYELKVNSIRFEGSIGATFYKFLLDEDIFLKIYVRHFAKLFDITYFTQVNKMTDIIIKTYNATVIQAFFRSYKVRKMLRQKARKAKKGGKKKKG